MDAKPSPVAAAAGHQEAAIGQPPVQNGTDNGAYVTAGESGNLDACPHEGGFLEMGQGPAHEQVYPKPGHLHGPLKRVPADQCPAFPSDLPVVLDLDDIEVVGHIEDRGDAFSPMGNCNLHVNKTATAVPTFCK